MEKSNAIVRISIKWPRFLQPEELFPAEDEDDWDEWLDFFSRTREPDGRRKGLVEIEL